MFQFQAAEKRSLGKRSERSNHILKLASMKANELTGKENVPPAADFYSQQVSKTSDPSMENDALKNNFSSQPSLAGSLLFRFMYGRQF